MAAKDIPDLCGTFRTLKNTRAGTKRLIQLRFQPRVRAHCILPYRTVVDLPPVRLRSSLAPVSRLRVVADSAPKPSLNRFKGVLTSPLDILSTVA